MDMFGYMLHIINWTFEPADIFQDTSVVVSWVGTSGKVNVFTNIFTACLEVCM